VQALQDADGQAHADRRLHVLDLRAERAVALARQVAAREALDHDRGGALLGVAAARAVGAVQRHDGVDGVAHAEEVAPLQLAAVAVLHADERAADTAPLRPRVVAAPHALDAQRRLTQGLVAGELELLNGGGPGQWCRSGMRASRGELTTRHCGGLRTTAVPQKHFGLAELLQLRRHRERFENGLRGLPQLSGRRRRRCEQPWLH